MPQVPLRPAVVRANWPSCLASPAPGWTGANQQSHQHPASTAAWAGSAPHIPSIPFHTLSVKRTPMCCAWQEGARAAFCSSPSFLNITPACPNIWIPQCCCGTFWGIQLAAFWSSPECAKPLSMLCFHAHGKGSETYLGMPLWAFVSYVGHKNPWDVKKVKHNSYKVLPQHTPLAEPGEPFACTSSRSCWGKKWPEKYSLSSTAQKELPPYCVPCLPHRNLQQGRCSCFFPCLESAESDSGVYQGLCHSLCVMMCFTKKSWTWEELNHLDCTSPPSCLGNSDEV